MKSIKEKKENLYEINKSKFIGVAVPIFSVDDFKNTHKILNEIHSKATHICYAYTLNNGSVEKCCDDGEPNGTAGKPILDCLKKKNLNNVAVFVVRYFGGIKLGAGGLTRAYSTSTSLVLDLCTVVEYALYSKYELFVDLKTANKIENSIKNMSEIKEFFIDYSKFNGDMICSSFYIKNGFKLPNLLENSRFICEKELME